MGFSPEWVRQAIDEGVLIHGVLVKLQAESIDSNGRRLHRIHVDAFVTFLKAIGWARLPKTANRRNRANRANQTHRANRASRSLCASAYGRTLHVPQQAGTVPSDRAASFRTRDPIPMWRASRSIGALSRRRVIAVIDGAELVDRCLEKSEEDDAACWRRRA